jgi:hypothetical protein
LGSAGLVVAGFVVGFLVGAGAFVVGFVVASTTGRTGAVVVLGGGGAGLSGSASAAPTMPMVQTSRIEPSSARMNFWGPLSFRFGVGLGGTVIAAASQRARENDLSHRAGESDDHL